MTEPFKTPLHRALNDLKKVKDAPAPPAKAPVKPPKDFSPVVEVETGKAALVVTQGFPVDGPDTPDSSDHEQVIRDNGLDPAQWTVTSWRRATWQTYHGEWLESFRATLAPRYGSAEGEVSILPDLDDLHRMVRRDRRVKVVKAVATERVLIVSLSDFQIGKTGSRGGTAELLTRMEATLGAFKEHAKRVKPSEIILLDGGDLIEGFENTGSQDRTNDASLTEQIRLGRRILWSWVECAAALAPKVTFGGVGSNHCRVRRGKATLGNPADDYGIEIVAQLADMASVHSEKYGHVSFFTPGEYEEGLLLPLPNGKGLGLIHGHQVSSMDKIPSWWAGQSLGRTPVGQADYLVTAHFHNLRISTCGDGRFWLASPTFDAGSDWYRNLSGNESDPGVMTFVVEADGSWGTLAIL